MATTHTADNASGFRVVRVDIVADRQRIQVTAEPTACADLVVAPYVRITASRKAVIDDRRLALVQTSTGRRVAAAQAPQALHDLARRLAWFDRTVIDADYLADPANDGVLASITELFEHWRTEQTQAAAPPAFFVTRSPRPR